MTDSIWPTIHAERRALASDLSDITTAQWESPSLCEGWTIEQVLAHLVATAKLTPATFLGKLIGAGFRFNTFAEKGIAAERRGGPAAVLTAFTALEQSTTSPPGPKISWLGEVLVHSEDIRRPLGIKHSYPADAVTKTIDFYAGSNALMGGKRRVAGLTLQATDTDWLRGSGPVVEGPAMSLLLATSGREAALDDLSGPGVALLRAR